MSHHKKITLFILTRDFRTSDALTLYQAYNEAKKSKTNLSVAFRFHPDQIDPNKNPYYSETSVEFMIGSLERLRKEDLPFQWIDPVSDDEWGKYLLSVPLHKIFIARDFTPFARNRFDFYQTICETIEVDDITVFPIEEIKPFSKLAFFISSLEHKKFPEVKNLKVNWSKEIDPLPTKNFIHSGKITIQSKGNRLPIVHPEDLENLIQHLGENIKGYANKKMREQVGDPRVSHLSAFIKFGLISIREVHHLAKECKGPSSEDKKAFHRELYFRDFYYALAWYKPKEVFEDPDWEQKNPKFISEKDLKEWRREMGKSEQITEKDKSEIQASAKIFQNWIDGTTESPLINAGMKELNHTGYMLNRMRMLTTSYLTRDHGLWWKYAEQVFANELTDYDWTINSMNHQNIAKIGLYPKYTQDFSVKRQESMNQKDKEIYIEKNK
jgi:deoxyribodipyrimidine photolyase